LNRNTWISLAGARLKDNGTGDVAEIIEEIIAGAEASGLVPEDYDHDVVVKASTASRTPRTLAGESEAKREARSEKESEHLALDELLQLLPPLDRQHYSELTFFLDPKTGKVESKELRRKRSILWASDVEGPLRANFEDLIQRCTHWGDFYSIFTEVMRIGKIEVKESGVTVTSRLLSATITANGPIATFGDAILYVERQAAAYVLATGTAMDLKFQFDALVKMGKTHYDAEAVRAIKSFGDNGHLDGPAGFIWSLETLHERLKKLDESVPKATAKPADDATALRAQEVHAEVICQNDGHC
jgi:hypothetical protein